jgi:hypothetical protein
MDRKWPAIVLGVWAAAVLIACAGVQVSQDYKAGTDFSGISSFSWASDTQEETGDVRVDSPLMDERIRGAVTRSLTGRGLREAQRSEADVWVRYHFEIRSKIRSDDVRGGVGIGYGTYGRGGGIVINSGSNVQSYDEGMLAIDLLRPEDEKILWRGYATFRYPPHATPEKTTQQVNDAVEKTLAQFPPAGPQE